jgi:transposase
MAGAPIRADAQQQMPLLVDESGFYPLPGGVRPWAPTGQTQTPREWWTRDHLSAVIALCPDGQLFCHCQDHALDSGDVAAVPERLLRELPGRMVLIWEGAPIHRGHPLQEFLANGASQRLHLERLPTCAPELYPGEGVRLPLRGVEVHNVCCFDPRQLRGALRTAVKGLRRKPRLRKGCFAVAGL